MTDAPGDTKAPAFPIFLDLERADVLVVGGGDVAARRAETAVRTGARVRLAAAEIGPDLQRMIDAGDITALGRDFETQDIDGCRLVMVATEDDVLNARVSALAQAARIPVNVADNLTLCTFIMPAIVDRAPIIAAVSTGGAAPILARRAKTAIEAALPAALGDLARYGRAIRARVNTGIPRGRNRRLFWEHFAAGPIAERVAAGDMAAADTLVQDAIDTLGAVEELVEIGEIAVLGTGRGDPEMLSMLALRLMQGCDMVFHEEGVPPAILDLARKDAPRRMTKGREKAWRDVVKAAHGHALVWLMAGAPTLPAGADADELLSDGIMLRVLPAAG